MLTSAWLAYAHSDYVLIVNNVSHGGARGDVTLLVQKKSHNFTDTSLVFNMSAL